MTTNGTPQPFPTTPPVDLPPRSGVTTYRLFVEVTDEDGGTREVWEPDEETMLALGWVSATTASDVAVAVSEGRAVPLGMTWCRACQECVFENHGGTRGKCGGDQTKAADARREAEEKPIRLTGPDRNDTTSEAGSGKALPTCADGAHEWDRTGLFCDRCPAIMPLDRNADTTSEAFDRAFAETSEKAGGKMPSNPNWLRSAVADVREKSNPPGSARNTGDIALETVSALVDVLEGLLDEQWRERGGR